MLIASTITVGNIFQVGLMIAAFANNSLLTKPEKIGIPTMDREPTAKPIPAILLRYPEPFSAKKLLLPADTSVSPMALINSSDFVAACTRMW